MLDPIRSHAGGARWLARQGISVDRGVLEGECRELNRGFLSVARAGRPWFTLKAAMTLDGRVATRAGASRWITGTAARRDGHQLRDRLDAMLVGIGTVLADDPRMTVRGVPGGRNPVRVVVDSRLRTPLKARLLRRGRAIIACAGSAPRTRERRLAEAGAEVWRLPADGRRVDLRALATRLGESGITTVLAEGGSDLHAGLIEADLADELVLYVAPLVFGGAGALAWAGGLGVGAIAEAKRFRLHGEPRRVGEDLALTYRPRRRR